jgi:hypothetical protein
MGIFQKKIVDEVILMSSSHFLCQIAGNPSKSLTNLGVFWDLHPKFPGKLD